MDRQRLEAVWGRGLLGDLETLWLDRGYDGAPTRQWLSEHGITDAIVAKNTQVRRRQGSHHVPDGVALAGGADQLLVVELRPDATQHRLAQLALAIALILTAKLIDWRNRGRQIHRLSVEH
jgi:hypothetical protein